MENVIGVVRFPSVKSLKTVPAVLCDMLHPHATCCPVSLPPSLIDPVPGQLQPEQETLTM